MRENHEVGGALERRRADTVRGLTKGYRGIAREGPFTGHSAERGVARGGAAPPHSGTERLCVRH